MRPFRILLAGALALLAPAAPAQLRLPALPTPSLPALPLPDPRAAQSLLSPEALQTVRARAVAQLLRDHPRVLEPGPAGEPIRRGELLLLTPPPALLDAARAAGFTVAGEQALDGLGPRLVVLRAPPGLATAAALERLRALDPALVVDLHHLYTPSGALTPDGPTAAAAPPAAELPATGWRVGLVDGGVDAGHPALRRVPLKRHGCGGDVRPAVHGTAVASLLVGRARGLVGAAPGAALYAADVYCGDGPGGSVAAVADALAWLARERVAVINISLVGPPNRALQAVVEALLARGHLLVAAVGNDGPAAPPLYPAAYPGVVGVTAVDGAQRVLPEAGRGTHVTFAAPGAELAAAVPGGAHAPARGTSFAAPLVAGLLARRLASPGVDGAAAALHALTREAVDLGAPGRDPVYGWGLVASELQAARR